MTGSAGRLTALAVIPARLASTRLPRKMLLRETGAYLFEHTARAVLASGAATRVVIATDSAEIEAAARAVGLEALRTSAAHQSGTDRVHEAAAALDPERTRYAVVLNVQGDEAEIDASALPGLIALFADPAVECASLHAPLEAELAADPAAVKVVCAANGDALYFSRAAIPSSAHPSSTRAVPPRLHLGVYAFRPAALARFCALPPSPLERTECLEQLRWLEAGARIRMHLCARASRGIDTPEDYRAFAARLASSRPPVAKGAAPGA